MGSTGDWPVPPVSLRRKQKLQRPPFPLPPVELVVLAAEGFGPLVAPQAGPFQLRLGERMLVGKVEQGLPVFPADAPEFGRHGVRVVAVVVISGRVNCATVDVNAEGLAPALVRLEDVLEEVPLLDLKRPGNAGRQAEDLRVFPRQS